MMRRFYSAAIFVVVLSFLLMCPACSKRTSENPFDYPFVQTLQLERKAGKPYSDYKAFYLLTEDFEPVVETAFELDSIRQALKFASDLSSKYSIRWTHFVDVNTLSGAFLSDNEDLKTRCQGMIGDLKALAEAGDDCQLHLHGPLNPDLYARLRAEGKVHIPGPRESAEQYRQRRSFFYQSVYRVGYRELAASLTYGKRLLEESVYGGRKQVLAFRPGGWDHGSNQRNTFLYFEALGDAGLVANSGLSQGDFGGKTWRVGNDPGRNLAAVIVSNKKIIEVSPTAGPGGYINPVLPHDLNKLANSVKDQMPVLVTVYHLGALQRSNRPSIDPAPRSESDLQSERGALEQHFKTVAELTAAKTLYPITLRELLAVISEQQ